MMSPTPADVAQRTPHEVVPSEGPSGDAPLDETLAELIAAADAMTPETDAADVISAARALHERIENRLEEAR